MWRSRRARGWLFVCDALVAAGAVPHSAEPVETRALRGRKRRAKTDREDARWLRDCSPRAGAGGVDPARACPPMALAGAAATHPDRGANPVATAHPSHAHRNRCASLRSPLTRRQADPARLPQLRWALYEAALAACRPSSPDHQLPRAEGPRAQPHPRLADDLTQARAPLLPRIARTRARRPGADHDALTRQFRSARPTLLDDHAFRQLPQLRGTRPRAAGHQRPSGRSHSARTDRSTIT
jgi:hypothetical protein